MPQHQNQFCGGSSGGLDSFPTDRPTPTDTYRLNSRRLCRPRNCQDEKDIFLHGFVVSLLIPLTPILVINVRLPRLVGNSKAYFHEKCYLDYN